MFSFEHETSPGYNNNFYKINTGEWKTSNLFFLIGEQEEEKQTKLVNLKVLYTVFQKLTARDISGLSHEC
jgi:hypothetical protein